MSRKKIHPEAVKDTPYAADVLAAGAEFEAKAKAEAEAKQGGQTEQTEQAEQYTFLSALDVLALKPEPWCVKGLLPASGIAAIFGQPGAGKTFIALDMALSVAEGRDWFDIQTHARPVVYVNLESRQGLRKRLMAWQEENISLPENIRFIVDPFHLMADVDKLARGIEPGSVVFLDTLNAAAFGLDENSSVDMGKIIEAAKKLQLLIDGLVVLVHHGGKDISKGLRGHSSLLGALDAVIEVTGTAEGRFWQTTKLKEAECNTRRGFKLKSVDIGMDEDGEPETSCIVEPDDTALPAGKSMPTSLIYGLESLRRALEGEEAQSVHIETWRKYFYERHTADNTPAKKAAFRRARKGLLEHGQIAVKDDYYSLSGANGTNGTNGTCPGTVPVAHTQDGTEQNGTSPLRGCSAVPLFRLDGGGGHA